MLSKDYEIFYYTDSKLVDVGSHSHDYYEFYFFMSGNVLMHINGTDHEMKSGDVMLIPPGVKHNATIIGDESYHRIVLWISREYMQQLRSISEDYGYIIYLATEEERHIFPQEPLTFNEIRGKAFRLISEIHSMEYGRDTQIQVCIQDLLLFLNRTIYNSANKRDRSDSSNIYQNILSYISDHIDEDLSLDQIAGEFFISRYYISHLFKENSGLSLHQYIIKKRLALCLPSILAGEEMSSCLSMFGFGDYTSFYRAFKKEYGMSPSEYKDINQVRQAQR